MQASNTALSPYQAIYGPPTRMASIDTYRGIVMFLMLAEVLHLDKLGELLPESRIANWISFHTSHVAWTGCSLHDMIQPSFSFLVGVSLPFSIAARQRRGSSFAAMAGHALWRSILLIFLGIALRSLGPEHTSTNFFFVDTLTQIGLGYFVLFLLANCPRWLQAAAVAGILVGYWALFATWPLPAEGFDSTQVGVPADWAHNLSGFAAHWNKNTNPAAAFDIWFMNLFPQKEPFVYNSGGYATLNFIPTLATMLLGALAGGILHRPGTSVRKAALTLLPGVLFVVAGWAAGGLDWCPVVKRIWTPAWVLYSGGLCFLALGLLYLLCDVAGWRAWAWPMMVIGANSITAYVMSWTMETPIQIFLLKHIGDWPFRWAGEAWEPLLQGSAILAAMWLILLWLYRQRIFVRI